jgi:DNA polymerase-3 subunit delta'
VWQVVGQTRVLSLLQCGLERGFLGHAYLFVGPPHVGKMTLAINLAQALNCMAAEPPCGVCSSCQEIDSARHPDIQIIGLSEDTNSAEAKLRAEIGINQIREIQHSASLPPFEGRYKVFIVNGAELLSIEAANCLLKTLEEPLEKIIFILLATNDSLLPSTVISRCQRVELFPLAAAGVEAALNQRGIELSKARLLSRLCHGCVGWAITAAYDSSLLQQRADQLDMLSDIINANYEERFTYATQLAARFSQDRGAVQEVLDLWLDYWRDLLLIKAGCSEIITNIDRLAVLVEASSGFSLFQIKAFIDNIRAAGEQLRQNANSRLVLETLMLNIPEKEGRSKGSLAARVEV